MKEKFLPFLLFSLVTMAACANSTSDTLKKTLVNIVDADNAGLKLPKGFGASKYADNVGRARHIAITPQGTIYVKSSKLVNGKGILMIKDTDGDGKAEIINSFGDYIGTDIGIYNGYLYASSDDDIYRYKLNDKSEVINPDQPEMVIKGLPNKRQHENKCFAFDGKGNIYVDIGAYSNSCQERDRTKGSKGMMPCPVLKDAGGVWVFNADKINQTQADGTLYATGLRNVVGITWNTQTNSLFAMQHGRDQLFQNWPEYFDSLQSAELPSECMYELPKGADAGWPYIFYDHIQGKKILAPEYGGDGKKEGGKDAINPVVGFPGHMAPNAILFYTGNQFPARYKNGAFIAFHGSWNRAPLPQKGYFVVFQPFKNGKPSGEWEVFADGFSGKEVVTSTRSAEHRPCGLAQGSDGSLYVSDDNKGTIYKISYPGK